MPSYIKGLESMMFFDEKYRHVRNTHTPKDTSKLAPFEDYDGYSQDHIMSSVTRTEAIGCIVAFLIFISIVVIHINMPN